MKASGLYRRGLASGGLLAVCALAACHESSLTAPVSAPASPVVVNLLSTTTVGWDFTALLNTLPGVQLWGTSKSVANSPYGAIDLTTDGAGTTLTAKGLELPVGDAERGLGLRATGAAHGDEVGDLASGILFMNFNSVLPAGSQLVQVDIGSVQLHEGWKISYSTTGLGGSYALLWQGEGDGSNNVGDVLSFTGSPLPLATANLVLKFEKNTGASGNASTDNDYVVRSVVTSFTEDLGCTFTWGYWKNHAGTGPQADAWPSLPGGHLFLGSVSYTKTQLLSIMNKAVAGNGLVSLAHQLIGAKLNILNGADPTAISATITAADALIGSRVVPPVGSGSLTPASVSALVNALDSFNTGTTGPGHCSEEILPIS